MIASDPVRDTEYGVRNTPDADSEGVAVRHNGPMFGTPQTDRGHLFASP